MLEGAENDQAGSADLAGLTNDELQVQLQRLKLQKTMRQFAEPGWASDHALSNLSRQFGYPECGTSRLVFADRPNGRVLKVAICAAGATENQHELNGIPGIKMARSDPATFDGIGHAIWMEWVEAIDARRDIPIDERARYEWVRMVDMMQVGRNSAGEIVAYDGGRAGPEHRFQEWERKTDQ